MLRVGRGDAGDQASCATAPTAASEPEEDPNAPASGGERNTPPSCDPSQSWLSSGGLDRSSADVKPCIARRTSWSGTGQLSSAAGRLGVDAYIVSGIRARAAERRRSCSQRSRATRACSASRAARAVDSACWRSRCGRRESASVACAIDPASAAAKAKPSTLSKPFTQHYPAVRTPCIRKWHGARWHPYFVPFINRPDQSPRSVAPNKTLGTIRGRSMRVYRQNRRSYVGGGTQPPVVRVRTVGECGVPGQTRGAAKASSRPRSSLRDSRRASGSAMRGRATKVGQKTLDMEPQTMTGNCSGAPRCRSSSPRSRTARGHEPAGRPGSAPSPPGRTRATRSPPRSSVPWGSRPTSCRPAVGAGVVRSGRRLRGEARPLYLLSPG